MANGILNINDLMPNSVRLNTSGQTLISLLIALSIFGILTHAILTLTTAAFKTVSFSRARITARHLTQEKIEVIRNMPYDDIGTVGGIPSGILPQTENRLINGLNFVIKTSIVFIDDPFDGQSPNDLLPTDYKRVRVDASWQGAASSGNNPIVLTTDISPKGIEESTGGGTLSILVFDSEAEPVPQATVHIFSDTTNPDVDLTLNTNDNGRIIIPGAPACQECYDITVTKSGYSQDRTYTSSEVANPDKPPLSVVVGLTTESSYVVDELSTLTVYTLSDRESSFTPIPNTAFILRGQKTIGTDINDFPVYKFNRQFNTDESGKLTITDVEWDIYTISLPSPNTYQIGTSNPTIPYALTPETTTEWRLSLYPSSQNNLRVQFVDSNNIPVASVSATLEGPGGFSQVKNTGGAEESDWGQVFYADLLNNQYTLTATSSAHQDSIKNINVNGSTEEKVILIEN